MAMGITSYSSKSGKRPKRGKIRRFFGGAFQTRLPRSLQNLFRGSLLWRILFSLLAFSHLLLVAVLPGGRNLLFGISIKDAPGYLTLFQPEDAFGFYTTQGKDGFLMYKIYTQNGKMVEGVFPSNKVLPRIRYDRWAVAGDAAARPFPQLHALVIRHILNRLPSPPLRMELFAARWILDRDSLTYPWPGNGPLTSLDKRLIGTYNGLTQAWTPAANKADQK